jgi:ubiquinone/menaquinone biosynthesis C-methylase UbiE
MADDTRDRMPDFAFRMMSAVMAVKDRVYPMVDQRVARFDIRPGMTVVDYGCGPGRYTVRFARRVGPEGRVYAVDIQPLAVEAVRRKMQAAGLDNIRPVLARGYHSGLPDHAADCVCALDMFFGLAEPSAFLREVRRLLKPEGRLILDDGHQSRASTLRKLHAAGGWRVVEETRGHLVCAGDA